jgi:hypothetical protein
MLHFPTLIPTILCYEVLLSRRSFKVFAVRLGRPWRCARALWCDGYFFQSVSNNDDNLGQIYTHDDQVGAGTMSNYWGWKINNKDMWPTDYYTKDCQGAWKLRLKVDLQ